MDLVGAPPPAGARDSRRERPDGGGQASRRRIVVEWLPPYAPDLNPAEHVWGHTTYGALANFAPEDLTTLETAAGTLPARTRGEPALLAGFIRATLRVTAGYGDRAPLGRARGLCPAGAPQASGSPGLPVGLRIRSNTVVAISDSGSGLRRNALAPAGGPPARFRPTRRPSG
jgi:putative transposase